MSVLLFVIFIILQTKCSLTSSFITENEDQEIGCSTDMVCDVENEPSVANAFCHKTTSEVDTIDDSANCYLWDDECVTAFAQKVAPSLKKYILENTAEIEPIYIASKETIKEGFRIDKTNIRLYGFKNIVVDSLSFDTKTNISRFIFHTNLYMNGHYKASGILFSNPVFGEGNFGILLKHVEVEIILQYNVFKNDNNEDSVEIKDYLLRYDVKTNAEFVFENMYGGNKELSNRFHLFLNKYWKMITEIFDFKSIDFLVATMVKAFRHYFKTVPLSTLTKL